MSQQYPQHPVIQKPAGRNHGLKLAAGITGIVLGFITVVSCTASLAGGESAATDAAAGAPSQRAEPNEAPTEEPASSAEPTQEATPSEEAEPTEEPVSSLPADEEDFIDIVTTGVKAADEAENDLQAGRALTKRDKALKKGDFDSVKNWRGTVKTLDSNGDGHGVLTVELAPNVSVATWNNAFSDIEDETLIKSEKMMDTLADMSEGDEIVFSGKFITDAGVPDNKGLTKIGKLQDPEFVFRFSSVKAG